tara:strand:+ start:42 stop:875 length:834 start_codon:yes stop_codon:yes gene_type:complete
MDGKNENTVGSTTEDFFLKETLISAESLKKNNPELPVTIFSNVHQDILKKSSFFDNILPCTEKKGNRKFINKIASCINSPYDETLFLDGDTLVLVNFQDVLTYGYDKHSDRGNIFDILRNFDMAFCLESLGCAKAMSHFSIPDTFSRFNTGVLLWKNNETTQNLFRDWFVNYRDSINFDPSKNDQWQFRMSIWNSRVRFCILDHAYNQRFYTEAGSCGNGDHVVKKPFYYHYPNDFDLFWEHVKRMNNTNPFKIVHDRLLIHNKEKWCGRRNYERRI